MNQDEYYSHLLSWAKSQRTSFINSKKYVFFSMQIILQLLNLMENKISLLEIEQYKPSIELISLYKNYLELNEKSFNSQDIELLKKSLDNSMYATIVPELLAFEIKKLVPNKKESFLLLPLTIVSYDTLLVDWSFHEISCRIQNKNNYIQLEFFDKAHQFHSLRKNFKQVTMDPHSKTRNKRDIINYFYIISPEKINQLSLILSLGTIHVRNQINEIITKKESQKYSQNKEKSNIQEIFFSKIKNLSINEHYGDITSTSQNLVGNCLIKELDIALKVALGERKISEISKIKFSPSLQGIQGRYLYTSKIPGISSTKEIYLSLISILLDRLDTLKFDPLMSKEIAMDMFSIYSYLKCCRENSPLTKKLQTYLTNKFYKNQNLSISKSISTNIHTDHLHMNIQNINSIKYLLNQKSTSVPKHLHLLKDVAKKEKKSQQKKFKKSIIYKQPDHSL